MVPVFLMWSENFTYFSSIILDLRCIYFFQNCFHNLPGPIVPPCIFIIKDPCLQSPALSNHVPMLMSLDLITIPCNDYKTVYVKQH